jgi:hypothetical protein
MKQGFFFPFLRDIIILILSVQSQNNHFTTPFSDRSTLVLFKRKGRFGRWHIRA